MESIVAEMLILYSVDYYLLLGLKVPGQLFKTTLRVSIIVV